MGNRTWRFAMVINPEGNAVQIQDRELVRVIKMNIAYSDLNLNKELQIFDNLHGMNRD